MRAQLSGPLHVNQHPDVGTGLAVTGPSRGNMDAELFDKSKAPPTRLSQSAIDPVSFHTAR